MNYNTKIKRCKCCVMPEVKGKFEFDNQGICKICREQLKNDNFKEQSFDNKTSEEKIQILKHKIKKIVKPNLDYDCAVAVSGGKDSIMTLYIAVKQLNLKPLAIFVDNGFALEQMYDNVKNATDILGIDLIMYKTSEISELFNMLLKSNRKIYYCRVCHAILDMTIDKICKQNNINLVLGGYTKGQQYIKNSELFDIYKSSDENVISLIKDDDRFNKYYSLLKKPNAYFREHFGDIYHLSPFKYIDWNEDEIIKILKKELKFKLPERSWPDKSSNCSFNYVSQYLAMKQFGFAQHESELSCQVRNGELSRQRALEIIETPIETEDLERPLDKLQLNLNDIL